MIAINKQEKEEILKRFPHVCIVRTMKQKSGRHRYYCEEQPAVVRFIKTIRGEIAEDKRGADRYKSRKNA